jgi:hypothetical protein
MTSQTKNKIKAAAIMAAVGVVIYAAIEIIKFLGIKGLLVLGGMWAGRLVWKEIYKTLEDRENRDKTNNK